MFNTFKIELLVPNQGVRYKVAGSVSAKLREINSKHKDDIICYEVFTDANNMYTSKESNVKIEMKVDRHEFNDIVDLIRSVYPNADKVMTVLPVFTSMDFINVKEDTFFDAIQKMKG